MIATLPMHDQPWLRAANDALWAGLRDALRAGGFDAPDALERGMTPAEAWARDDLLLSQTCGLPWRERLHRRLALVGTPDYCVEGCPPGHYRSVIVRRRDDHRPETGLRWAFNARDSQSGFAALGPLRERLGEGIETGSHVASIHAVAEGRADLAAIDAVTWRGAAHLEAARALRVAGFTPPSPGLPFVTALRDRAGGIARAVRAGVASAPAGAREALGLRGVVALTPADYALRSAAASR